MYKLCKNSELVMLIIGDIVKFIPNDINNKDHQEYMAWLAQGNQPLAAD